MKTRKLYCIAIIVCIILNVTNLTAISQGTRINVPENFAKIQDAINSSVDGDTIVVAPGTYYENVNFRGKNILLTSHYLFDEDISFINTTIIDGSNPQFPDTASVVVFMSDEKKSAILQGFTITGGKGTIIDDGFVVRIGGGIVILKSSPTIRHNIIAFNEAINSEGVSFKSGGGISADYSSAIISNNIIYKNKSNSGGGVILGPNPGLIFRNNVIAYNTDYSGADTRGAVWIRGDQGGKFINNTIAFNSTGTSGGIGLHNNPRVNIENCIIFGNTTGSSNPQIVGSGSISITNSNIEGAWAGDGNIDENPMFLDSTALFLQIASPCIDMGNPNTANNDFEDPDNPGFALLPALGTTRNDMGAYGGNQYKSMPYMNIPLPGYIQNSIIKVPENFANIQDAINSSVDGDTIVVAPGTYYENVNFRGKNVLLTSHYLYDEDVSFINTTIIDGSNPHFPDTASVVVFLSGEENAAILQGFTITGGKGSKTIDVDLGDFVRAGGGINIYQSSPTIRHNIIAFNEAINPAGVRLSGGGGIYAQYSSAIISNNIIYKNNAKDGGGVLLGPNPESIFKNNIIAYNTTFPTNFGGGGAFIRANQGKFINNTIAFNHSDGGGGIHIHNSPIVNIENCIIYGNKTGSTNAQIKTGSGKISITNSNIEGAWAGEGNIDESPLFKDHTPLILQDGSPCIDLGDTSTANNDREDPENPGFALLPALGTLRNDMGAYGGNQYKSMPYRHMLNPTKIIVGNSHIKSEYVSGVDTVVVSSKIESPEDQAAEVKALFKSSDGSVVETVVMLDDGSVRDSIAGDGWYTAAWVPNTDNLYSVDISVYLKEYKEMVTLEKAFNFTTISPITGIEDAKEILPNGLTLNQNYPNPFSNSTTISYSISEPAATSLKVYDMSGKEIKTLVNEYQTMGSYSIEFDASSLQGGAYIYQMKSGEFTDIKKLILIK